MFLERFLGRPALYAPGTSQFWADGHIAKALLQAHLDPASDAASRTPAFMDRSVGWIASMAPPARYPALLDLGCGPGLYARRFHGAGYQVTGVDFSQRSIEYAKAEGDGIAYIHQDYLSLTYDCRFDVVTLIYCDFGVLSTQDRAALLDRVYRALRPGGKFVFDVFTPARHAGRGEQKNWEYCPDGGFWDAGAHLCLHSFYRYDEDNTVLDQTVVATDTKVECYNIWEHCFTEESLAGELRGAGFDRFELFDDIAGKPYGKEGDAICAVATK